MSYCTLLHLFYLYSYSSFLQIRVCMHISCLKLLTPTIMDLSALRWLFQTFTLCCPAECFYASCVCEARGIIFSGCPSHFCESVISRMPYRNFFIFGINVHLDSSMHWLDFGRHGWCEFTKHLTLKCIHWLWQNITQMSDVATTVFRISFIDHRHIICPLMLQLPDHCLAFFVLM